MNDTPAETPATTPEKPLPVYRLEPAQRYAHIVSRMAERGDLQWTAEQVAHLESRIKFVIAQLDQGKPVAPILPKPLATEKMDTISYWRVLIAAEPHTVVFSKWANGLISYVGRGEIVPANKA